MIRNSLLVLLSAFIILTFTAAPVQADIEKLIYDIIDSCEKKYLRKIKKCIRWFNKEQAALHDEYLDFATLEDIKKDPARYTKHFAGG